MIASRGGSNMTRAISGGVTKIADDCWRVQVSAGHDPVSGELLLITRRVQGGGSFQL